MPTQQWRTTPGLRRMEPSIRWSMVVAAGSGEVLALTSLTSSDSGQYFCEARNREGAHKSTVVSLTIQGANQGECRGKCPVLLNQYVLNEYIFSCIVPCHFQLQRLSKCQFTSVPRPQFSWWSYFLCSYGCGKSRNIVYSVQYHNSEYDGLVVPICAPKEVCFPWQEKPNQIMSKDCCGQRGEWNTACQCNSVMWRFERSKYSWILNTVKAQASILPQ